MRGVILTLIITVFARSGARRKRNRQLVTVRESMCVQMADLMLVRLPPDCGCTRLLNLKTRMVVEVPNNGTIVCGLAQTVHGIRTANLFVRVTGRHCFAPLKNLSGYRVISHPGEDLRPLPTLNEAACHPRFSSLAGSSRPPLAPQELEKSGLNLWPTGPDGIVWVRVQLSLSLGAVTELREVVFLMESFQRRVPFIRFINARVSRPSGVYSHRLDINLVHDGDSYSSRGT